MIILSGYSFTLTNFISPFCTEMQRPNCPVTETARPNRPDRKAQTEMAQTKSAQTETVRPNRPNRNGQTEMSCLPLFVVTKRVLSNIAKL